MRRYFFSIASPETSIDVLRQVYVMSLTYTHYRHVKSVKIHTFLSYKSNAVPAAASTSGLRHITARSKNRGKKKKKKFATPRRSRVGRRFWCLFGGREKAVPMVQESAHGAPRSQRYKRISAKIAVFGLFAASRACISATDGPFSKPKAPNCGVFCERFNAHHFAQHGREGCAAIGRRRNRRIWPSLRRPGGDRSHLGGFLQIFQGPLTPQVHARTTRFGPSNGTPPTFFRGF